MLEIVVEPLGDAWGVQAAGAEPQLFSRGSLAEEAARNLAYRLADAGETVEVHILLRNGQRGARFVCLPPISDKDRPMLVGGTTFNDLIDAAPPDRAGVRS